MNIKEEIKLITTGLDISALREAVLSTTPEEWESFTIRQDVFSAQAHTKSIVLKFNGPMVGIDHPGTTKTFPEFSDWEALVMPIVSKVQEFYPSTVISKLFMPKLKANGIVQYHMDSGLTLELVHRIHIPIITNEKVDFHVGKEMVNMLEGNAYEINNSHQHGVKNGGDEARIHLMVDLYENT